MRRFRVQLKGYLIIILFLLLSFLVEWRVMDDILVASYEVYCEKEQEAFRKDAVSYILDRYRKYQNKGADNRHLKKDRNGLRRTLYEQYAEVYRDIEQDLVYFPIEKSYIGMTSYEDSWYDGRSFGGDRLHEGTDIMSAHNLPGEIPVISMTDGIVTNMGWLALGGWRIGIQSESGIYYYYAHLDSYVDNLSVGDKVTAGQLIGFLGNSGYGEEGTTGMFDVHLHVGIYMYDEEGREISINPYPFLKLLSSS